MTAPTKETALDRIRAEIRRMSAANKDSPTIPRVKTGGKPLESIRSLPDAVSERCRIFIVQGRDPSKHIEDPNRLVIAVCCDLVRASVDDETIYGVLTDDRFEISKHVLGRIDVENYVLRQIRKAKEYAIEPRLLELNEKHAVIENHGGRCRVLEDIQPDTDEKDGLLERKDLVLQSFDDFRNRYQNRRVQMGYDMKGKLIEKPLGAWWLDHPARRQYHTIVFAPGAKETPGVYNLWRGFAVKPQPGNKHLRYLDHIKENICSNSEEILAYLLGWMARAVQEPHTAGEVAVVLRGGKGTGKTIFADIFGRLFGRHYWAVSDAKYIVGNFNAHLRDCVVLFGDEAFWAGDRKHESVLKSLVTSRTLVIESKGVDAETAHNNVHLIMASNADWVVPASYDERRFLVLDVAKTHQGNKSYFNAIMREMETGGFANLLHMLQTMDISNFDVRSVPDTDALQDQKLHSMEPHEEWWYGKLRDGHLMPGHAGWTSPIPKESLVGDYLIYAQRISTSRRTNSTRLERFLFKCSSGMKQFTAPFRGRDAIGTPRVGTTVWWEFPSLEACRADFAKQVGGLKIDWPTIEVRSEPEADSPTGGRSGPTQGAFLS